MITRRSFLTEFLTVGSGLILAPNLITKGLKLKRILTLDSYYRIIKFIPPRASGIVTGWAEVELEGIDGHRLVKISPSFLVYGLSPIKKETIQLFGQ